MYWFLYVVIDLLVFTLILEKIKIEQLPDMVKLRCPSEIKFDEDC